MSGIDYESLDDLAVQDVLDYRGVDVTIENLRGSISGGEFEIEGYNLESCDEIDLCDILNLAYDEPVVCERRDVENSISEAEYTTLKISDGRRGEEVQKLQLQLEKQVERNLNLCKMVGKRDIQIAELKKPWWTKIPGIFSNGVK